MKIQEITELMEQMCKNGINVLEFEESGSRLRLERQAAVVFQPVAAAGPDPAGAALPASAEACEAPELPGKLILSPVVGVFYASPSPDSEPFVRVGSVVETGSPLCIIEAMKLMNEVTASFDGIVLEILAESGQRVEYGQPLMRIGGN